MIWLLSLVPVIRHFTSDSMDTLPYHKKRQLLQASLPVLPSNTLDAVMTGLLSRLLQAELLDTPLTPLSSLPSMRMVGSSTIALWKGDITTLSTPGAIINAANDQMLGCFQPFHKCIDNVIHSKAGVQLRDDCQTIMDRQGRAEPTGTAKITRGYNLPSAYVLHTVGPIVRGEVTPKHRSLLQSCYTSCLDLAAEVGLREVAFCSISTGVFGYPIQPASEAAVQAVTAWLQTHPGVMDTVLFNVFSDRDLAVYRGILE
ncbi:hypothetical protein KIPB_001427 [Kipferlia bialata]|uniref:Macro domain-containing protein n=1 Tax=Kipferlia bialata TaxID=797122 RepID=A0A9K3CQ83_9EUKA|nr:hypothetical protein KIPB_001427 [Kipferlia bialata]|eukprot:g1427.t1